MTEHEIEALASFAQNAAQPHIVPGDAAVRIVRAVLANLDAKLATLTRYDDVYRYGETVMLAVGEDNPRGRGEYVRFDGVREMLEGMIDAPQVEGDREGV